MSTYNELTIANLADWMDNYLSCEPVEVHIDREMGSQRVEFTYKLENLNALERRSIKRLFGPFRKTSFGTGLVRAGYSLPFPNGAFPGAVLRVEVTGVYECKTICTPVDHQAVQTEVDLLDSEQNDG